MTQTSTDQFDDTGKAVFDDAYNQADPRMYYEDLGRLGYRIAGEAQPQIARTVSALTEIRDEKQPKVIDIGSSYGINAALLNSDLTLGQLDEHYRSDEIANWNRERVLERDIEFFSENADEQCSIVGIDVSSHALQYAVDAGLLEAALAVNLEEDSLAPEEAAVLSDADLIMSTGAIGYVSETTFEQVLDTCTDSQPWVANSVLRMFPYDGFLELLDKRGYVTEKYESTLIQRGFASDDEQQNVLDNLRDIGVNPAGKEATGHYHAEFFLSRPRAEATRSIFEPLNTWPSVKTRNGLNVMN